MQKAGFETVIKDKLPAEELLEIIPDFDGLIVRSASKVTKEVIERAKKLKIVGRAGVGTDNIDINAATAHGIMVINSTWWKHNCCHRTHNGHDDGYGKKYCCR